MKNVDLQWNKDFWDLRYYDRSFRGGREWSNLWGSPQSQWNVTIYPRIFSFLPANSILEIGQGFGRWTTFLLPLARDSYRGIEMSEKSTAACQAKFCNQHQDVSFHLNDGLSLDAVSDKQYDFVFSFDSLIHAGVDVFNAYIPTLLNSLLTKNGVAFLHHSNMHAALRDGLVTEREADEYYLERGTSGEIIAKIIKENGGRVLMQERITCLGLSLSSCFTLFCKKEARYPHTSILFDNHNFDDEVALSKRIDGHYNYC